MAPLLSSPASTRSRIPPPARVSRGPASSWAGGVRRAARCAESRSASGRRSRSDRARRPAGATSGAAPSSRCRAGRRGSHPQAGDRGPEVASEGCASGSVPPRVRPGRAACHPRPAGTAPRDPTRSCSESLPVPFGRGRRRLVGSGRQYRLQSGTCSSAIGPRDGCRRAPRGRAPRGRAPPR